VSAASATRVLYDDGDVDLAALVARLWSCKGWIVATVLIFVGGFGVAAFTMTPLYRAATVVIPAASDTGGLGSLTSALGQLGGLASLAGINTGSGNVDAEEALAVLRSREFTERFIAENDLMSVLLYRRWDAVAGHWKGGDDKTPTLAEGFKYFNGRVRTVTRDARTGLITVQIVWKDPAQSAVWANDLVARLNNEMRARAIARTSASVEFLEKELTSTGAIETRQAIGRLIEAQVNQRMLANVTQEYAFRVVDRALPPDRTDRVRPRRLTMLALGAVLGFVCGVLLVLAGTMVASYRAGTGKQ
jgi:uncharacterized protein involved in exopolysaccharide biosynthesis